MRITKKILTFLVILFLSACSMSGVDNQSEGTKSTRTVTDISGREVTIPTEVEKIAALYAPTGHILALFGHGDKIVASPGGLKRDKLMTELYPSILEAAVPKESGKTNVEELAKVTPDLVFIDEKMLLDKGERKKFDKLKIPYVVIDFNTIEEQLQSIRLMGQILNEEEKAKTYLTYYNEKVNLVAERMKDIPESERVRVFHSINEATRTSAPNTLSNEWLEKAGVLNVSLDGELKFSENKYFASIEQIYLWNPDVILVNENGVDEYIRTKEQWRNITAVKDNRVYLLPNGLTRWGHPSSIEVPLAMLWTSKLLYPHIFEDIHLEEEIKQFYLEFFSISLDDVQISQILTGEGMRLTKGEEQK